jgi:hypothetical protein
MAIFRTLRTRPTVIRETGQVVDRLLNRLFITRLLPVVVGVLLLHVTDAEAGRISLRTSTTCTVMEKGVRVEVTSINTGNDTASDVQITAMVADALNTSTITHRLKPGESKTARIPLYPTLERPGVYAALVRVDFHDLNGHPFTAVSYGTFVHQEGGAPRIFVLPGETHLARRGELKLELANTDSTDQRVHIRLIGPREIHIVEPESEAVIPGREKATAIFHLKNLSAMAGAVYPLPAIIEYHADGRHMTTIGEIKLKIKPIRHAFVRYRSWLLIAVGMLLLAGVLIDVIRPGRPPIDG